MPKLLPGRQAFGEYNRNGYRSWITAEHGIRFMYSAGNHRQDSQQYAAPGSPEALSLRDLRRLCHRTTREFSRENQAAWGGVERTPDQTQAEFFARPDVRRLQDFQKTHPAHTSGHRRATRLLVRLAADIGVDL